MKWFFGLRKWRTMYIYIYKLYIYYHLWPGDPINCVPRLLQKMASSPVWLQVSISSHVPSANATSEANSPKNSVSMCLGMKIWDPSERHMLNIWYDIYGPSIVCTTRCYKCSPRIQLGYQITILLWPCRNAFGSLSFDSKLSEEDLWSAEPAHCSGWD